MDYAINVFSLNQDDLKLYKEIQRDDIYDIWKIEFNPMGEEIVSGTLSLKAYDINTGEIKREFNKGTKYIHSLAYVKKNPQSHNFSLLMVRNLHAET